MSQDKEGQVDRRSLLKGAAAAGLGAVTLGAAGTANAAETKALVFNGKTVQNLVVQMVGDPVFAQRVIDDPRAFQAEYNLSRRAVESIRGLRLEDFEHIAVGDPTSFAVGAMTSASMARADFDKVEVEAGDTCYYFG